MNIEGLNLPPHEHREYPKIVYEGGDLKGATRTVREPDEEAAAAAAGFLAVGGPVAEAGSEEAFAASQEHAPLAEPTKAKAKPRRKK